MTTMLNMNKIYNAVYRSGDPDRSKGFRGWQHKAQLTRKALEAIRAEMEQKVMELHGDYNENYIAGKLEEMRSEYGEIRKIALEKLEADLDAVVHEKRQQFQKIALSAPTDDQLRLIQSLALRDDLSESEVSTIAESMGGNLQALKALGSVARKAGLTFPHTITTEQFNEDLENAVSFSRNMMQSIDTPDKDLTYNARCLYLYDDTGTPRAVYGPLDAPLFAAVQKEPTAKETTAAKAAGEIHGEAWTQVTCSGNEYLSTIAAQFGVSEAELRKVNGLTDSDYMSPTSGQKLLVPSTRLKMQPGPGHISPEQCAAVPAPEA